MQLIKAFFISCFKHWGQKDKGGKWYIFHLLTVAKNVKTYDGKVVALLHDIVEDTDVTVETLKNMEFKPHIVESIKVITKDKKQSYSDYLKNIKQNNLATKVKIEDLKHNSNLTRLKEVTIKDIKRQGKYKDALLYLMQ